MDVKVQIKRPYRHFKGKLYYVHDIIQHTETMGLMVSYQALYEPYEMYGRPLEAFVEKVSKSRADNITKQTYKFEIYKGN